MLQQTRVETVIPYYERFLREFPNLESLAEAEEETVRAAWSGLGYYRRAKLMHQAAAHLVTEQASQWPTNAKALQKLPGFGRYTSGAVASIAFDEPVAAVDGNVMRVIARLQAIEEDATKGKANAQVWEFAENLAQTKLSPKQKMSAGDFTQAMIEFGALVCTAKSPKCSECPVLADCLAHEKGIQGQIPPPRPRAKRKTIELTAILCFQDDTVVMEQRPAKGIFAELWCLPLLEGDLEPDAALDEIERRWNWGVDHAQSLGQIKHVLTHRDVMVRLVQIRPAFSKLPAKLRTVKLQELDQLGIPSVTSKLLAAGLPATVLARTELPGRKTKTKKSRNKAQTTLFD